MSRQSILNSDLFPSSINTTNNEGNLWRQFWEGHGLSRLDIGYQRGLGDGDAVSVIETTMNPCKTKAIGLVVDKVDKIMHGMQLGAPECTIRLQWCHKGFLCSLVGYLLTTIIRPG